MNDLFRYEFLRREMFSYNQVMSGDTTSKLDESSSEVLIDEAEVTLEEEE